MTSTQDARPADRSDFEIAIICALSVESNAVEATFDEFWEDDDDSHYGKAEGDPNSYTLGRIGRHQVVLAYLPGMGKGAAASAVGSFRVSFPNIRLGLLVGICGGVPQPAGDCEEISLGDVIISTGVVQFDFGRQLADRIVRKDTLEDNLGRPNPEIRSFLHQIRGWRARTKLRRNISTYISDIGCQEGFRNWACPPRERDGDQSSQLQVHFGTMASGDVVMKSAEHRDRIAREEGVLGFEMEGAGVWDSFPTIIVKGVCDYADCHKDKTWQRYASVTAAASAKALLREWHGNSATKAGERSRPQGVLEGRPSETVIFNNYGGVANQGVNQTFNDAVVLSYGSASRRKPV